MRLKTTKYHNKKAEFNGYKFDSLKELQRYQELKLLERAGKICNLEVHPKYKIIVKAEQICIYIADFRYTLCDRFLGHPNGAQIVEDVKSKATKTQAYRLKKKLIYAVFGINIIEV